MEKSFGQLTSNDPNDLWGVTLLDVTRLCSELALARSSALGWCSNPAWRRDWRRIATQPDVTRLCSELALARSSAFCSELALARSSALGWCSNPAWGRALQKYVARCIRARLGWPSHAFFDGFDLDFRAAGCDVCGDAVRKLFEVVGEEAGKFLCGGAEGFFIGPSVFW